MPSATLELRAKWPGGDVQAMSYLKDRGFILTERWEWVPPKPIEEITEREWDAIDYMAQEWDFDGLATPTTSEDK